MRTFFFLIIPPPPRSTLFPYTTLFRSVELQRLQLDQVLVGHVADPDRREVGLAGHRTQTGELRDRHRDLVVAVGVRIRQDRKSTRLNSSHVAISYAVFCLKKKNNTSSS